MLFLTPPVFHFYLHIRTLTHTGSIHLSTKHPLKFPNGLNHSLTARFDFSNWTQEGGADNPAGWNLCTLPDQPTSQSLHRDSLFSTFFSLLFFCLPLRRSAFKTDASDFSSLSPTLLSIYFKRWDASRCVPQYDPITPNDISHQKSFRIVRVP